MAQQINLCTPILLTQKRYFSAQTMLQALSVFLLLGGVLCAFWVVSLNAASTGLKSTLDAQAPELASLQAAVAVSKADTGAGDSALQLALQAARTQWTERQAVLAELRRGKLQAGQGHAARLELLAQTIPSQVWVTELKADEFELDVEGYTLEPAALNDWVARLAANALLAGLHLATVKVEKVKADDSSGAVVAEPGRVTPANLGRGRPVWSFRLVNAQAPATVHVAGGQP